MRSIAEVSDSSLPEKPKTIPLAPSQWELAWSEFGRKYPRMKRGSSFIAFVIFTGLGQSLLGVFQWLYPILPWFAWPIMFLSTTVVALLFVVRFAGSAYERIYFEDTKRLEDRVEALEDFVNKPRLDLIFSREKPYFNILPVGRSGNIDHLRSYFRVRVKNNSGKNIDNVKVQIEELDGYYNIPLRILNDNTPFRNEFTLTPGQDEVIQVAEKISNEPGLRIVSTHRHSTLPQLFPLGEHRIKIVATGDSTMPCSREFTLSFDADGNLMVEPIAKPLVLSSGFYIQDLEKPVA